MQSFMSDEYYYQCLVFWKLIIFNCELSISTIDKHEEIIRVQIGYYLLTAIKV